jgi:hypothetical protein
VIERDRGGRGHIARSRFERVGLGRIEQLAHHPPRSAVPSSALALLPRAIYVALVGIAIAMMIG